MSDSTDKTSSVLASSIRTLAKGPMNFAFGIDGVNAGMLLHRTTSPSSLSLQLKQEQKLKKLTFGVATAEKRSLVLDIHGPPLSGIKKLVKVFLTKHKITMFGEVRLLSGDDETEKEAEPPVAAAETAPATTPGPTVSGKRAASTLVAAKALWPSEPAPIRRELTMTENGVLAKMPPEILCEENLTQCDPKTLFNDKYMVGLVGLKIQGANDAKLKVAMRKLAKGVSPGERKALIVELAMIRGVSAAKLDAEYDRFMILLRPTGGHSQWEERRRGARLQRGHPQDVRRFQSATGFRQGDRRHVRH